MRKIHFKILTLLLVAELGTPLCWGSVGGSISGTVRDASGRKGYLSFGRSWVLVFLAAMALFINGGIAGYAQVDTGALLGTITDESGAVIPGAQITLINQGSGFQTAKVTGPDGRYVFTPIKIGVYTVIAQKRGFRKVSRENIRVNVQQQVVVDFSLVPGAVTQTINVTSAAPLLQTQSASVGQVIGSQKINDLPLNGRNFTFLARLSAGVVAPQPTGYGLENTGSFNANGTRLDQNYYILDGIDNNNDTATYLNPASYVVLPPPDALEEFDVETSNFSAAQGRAGGAVLNATIKSGTNRIHGDAWEFLRNSGLDAANFFENAANQPKGEFRQNQFGFTLGGPVVIPHVYSGKDKTFFFADYQGTCIRQASPFVSTVPTMSERASGYTDLSDLISGQSGTRTDLLGRSFPLGTVFDPATTRTVTQGQIDPLTGLAAIGSGFVREPFPGNILPADRLDPNAIRLLDLYPIPNGPGLFNNFTSDPIIRDDLDQFDVRVDHNFGSKDQTFGRVSWSSEPKLLPGPFQGYADGETYAQGDFQITNLSAVWSETHSFSSTLINEFRLGYLRSNTTQLQAFANQMGVPQQFGIQGIPQLPKNGGLPYIIISGLSPLGPSNFMPEQTLDETDEVQDNLTKVYGSHTFKGGFELQHIRFPWFGPQAPRGQFQFDGTYTEVPNTSGGNTGLAQMLLMPATSTVPNGFNNVGGMDTVFASNFAGPADIRNYYAAYFQDDWKVTKKLTANLGLRYEYYDPIIEKYGAQANFVPGAPTSGAEYLIPISRQSTLLSSSFTSLLSRDGIKLAYSNIPGLVSMPALNFAPRVGLAYQIAPKWVLRTAYGIFYDSLEAIGGAPDIGSNYPFLYTFSFFSPDPAHPITYPNGSIATLENGMASIPLSPAFVNAEGLGLEGIQTNFQTPYVQEYNFTLQYQLTPNQSLQIGYVGNVSRHLITPPGNNEVSQILPPYLNPQTFVPFPDFARNSFYITMDGSASYNSLQTTFERRFSQGLDLLANFTWSKCRTDSEDILVGVTNPGYRAPYLPGFGIQGDYALCAYDVPHAVNLSGGYSFPFGSGHHLFARSRGLVDQLVSGWKMNFILTLRDGEPFTVGCPEGTTAGLGCAALLVPGENIIGGPHNVNQWMNPKAFANPPVATTIGQSNYAPLGGALNQLHSPGFHRLDFSLFKEFRTSESTHLEFRAEVFNLTNTPQFGFPAFTDFTNPTTFGQITSTVDGGYDQREIQFALKFYW
jgi:outer membrane receptor protein involved in Fe transport